jgi:hypothetical protein
MQVSIKCSGGFAGVERSFRSLDSRTLAQPAAARLARCIDELVAASRAQEIAGSADQFRYEFTITDAPGGAPNSFTIADDGNPSQPPMSLVAEIVALASA